MSSESQETKRRDLEQLLEGLVAHPIVSAVLLQLERELRPALSYHSLEHTRDVLREALTFAVEDGRSERDIELLALAAAYHDAGYLHRDEDNEGVAADMLVQAMKEHGGYSDTEIDLVRAMVLDTKLIQNTDGKIQRPHTELSRYLLDADMSNLGREDFFSRLESLIAERQSDRLSELKRTLSLMRQHDWLTAVARRMRQAQKQQNCERLEALVAKLEGWYFSSVE